MSKPWKNKYQSAQEVAENAKTPAMPAIPIEVEVSIPQVPAREPGKYLFLKSGENERLYNAGVAHVLEGKIRTVFFSDDNMIVVPEKQWQEVLNFVQKSEGWLHLSGEEKWLRMEPVYILHKLLPGSLGITFVSGRQFWTKNNEDQRTLLDYLEA